MYRLSKDEVEHNLKAAGCNAEIIREFFSYEKEDGSEKQRALLEEHRKTLLNHVHTEEKKISCLDYLIFQLDREHAM